jgi:dolichol kinase
MAIRIKLKTARRITLEGTLAALAVAFVIAYLIAPQFVAGLIWNAGLAVVTYWN